MNPKYTLPISEARKKIFEIAEDVQKPGRHYTLTEKGRPKAVVLSMDEYDSLMEDLEILGDPTALARIQKAEDEIDRGEFVTLDELKKELNYDIKHEFMLAEKASRQNQYRVEVKKKKRK
jgi:antitoxin YefM